MKHQTSAALYEYWLSCHRDHGVRAGGVKAEALAPLLPELFLLDLDPTLNARFRFCGATIAFRYGRDLTDESFLALWRPGDRETLARDLRAMSLRSTGMVAGVLSETMGGGFVAHEMLLLPLFGEHGGSGALGSMVRIGGHEEENRIKGRIVEQTLRSTRFLPAAGPRRPSRRDSALSTLPHAAMQRPRRYGHLTVVSGGK